MLPSIFNDNLFDDFFNFPFYNDKAERRAEKKTLRTSCSQPYEN